MDERSKTAAQHLWPHLPSSAKPVTPSWVGRERTESVADAIFPRHAPVKSERKRVWSDRESLLRHLRKANERRPTRETKG
jgi:hypothetical protein